MARAQRTEENACQVIDFAAYKARKQAKAEAPTPARESHWLLARVVDEELQIAAVPVLAEKVRKDIIARYGDKGWRPVFHVPEHVAPPFCPWDWSDPRGSFNAHLELMAAQDSLEYQGMAADLVEALIDGRVVFVNLSIGAA